MNTRIMIRGPEVDTKEPIKEFELGGLIKYPIRRGPEKIELQGGLTRNMNTRITIRGLEKNTTI
jgi:hypothetical protein